MPLLVAVWQNKITVRYNTANQIADVEGIGELKLVSSLITHHSSFFLSAPRFTAFLLLSFRSIAFLCDLCASAVKFGLPASIFLFPAPVITCYCGESNSKLSIKSVCCAISPCICPVFTGITVKMKRFWLQFGGVKSPGGAILPANRRCLVEVRKFGFFCSLFTIHYSLRSRCRLAKRCIFLKFWQAYEGKRLFSPRLRVSA